MAYSIARSMSGDSTPTRPKTPPLDFLLKPAPDGPRGWFDEMNAVTSRTNGKVIDIEMSDDWESMRHDVYLNESTSKESLSPRRRFRQRRIGPTALQAEPHKAKDQEVENMRLLVDNHLKAQRYQRAKREEAPGDTNSYVDRLAFLMCACGTGDLPSCWDSPVDDDCYPVNTTGGTPIEICHLDSDNDSEDQSSESHPDRQSEADDDDDNQSEDKYEDHDPTSISLMLERR